jgi:hypothetical protein
MEDRIKHLVGQMEELVHPLELAALGRARARRTPLLTEGRSGGNPPRMRLRPHPRERSNLPPSPHRSLISFCRAHLPWTAESRRVSRYEQLAFCTLVAPKVLPSAAGLTGPSIRFFAMTSSKPLRAIDRLRSLQEFLWVRASPIPLGSAPALSSGSAQEDRVALRQRCRRTMAGSTRQPAHREQSHLPLTQLCCKHPRLSTVFKGVDLGIGLGHALLSPPLPPPFRGSSSLGDLQRHAGGPR